MPPIIVEGPDGAGKTTLVEELIRQGIFRMPRSADTQGPITDLAAYVMSENAMIPHRKYTFLYDRHPLISEPIYGIDMRGKMPSAFQNMGWFVYHWQQLLAYDPLFIICLPPLDVVYKNVLSSRQMEGVASRTMSIYWHYHTLTARLIAQGCKVIVWNYTKHRYEQDLIPPLTGMGIL